MLQTFFSLHVATMEKKKLWWLHRLSVKFFEISSTRIRDIVTQRDADYPGLVLKDNARAVFVLLSRCLSPFFVPRKISMRPLSTLSQVCLFYKKHYRLVCSQPMIDRNGLH